VPIVIDPSSCGSFVSTTVAQQLEMVTEEMAHVTVRVGDRGKTAITTVVPELQWEC
jgi:hypothetical protein